MVNLFCSVFLLFVFALSKKPSEHDDNGNHVKKQLLNLDVSILCLICQFLSFYENISIIPFVNKLFWTLVFPSKYSKSCLSIFWKSKAFEITVMDKISVSFCNFIKKNFVFWENCATITLVFPVQLQLVYTMLWNVLNSLKFLFLFVCCMLLICTCN